MGVQNKVAPTSETEVSSNQNTETDTVPKNSPPAEVPVVPKTPAVAPVQIDLSTPKVSAFSLSSIKAKKEYEAQQLSQKKETENLPTDTFTESNMLLHWNKFASMLTEQNKRLMATYMQMSVPKLVENAIVLELPNESTKEEFMTGNYELVRYLRTNLNNFEVEIIVHVNEEQTKKQAFTPQDKYEHLLELNPFLEQFKRKFELDF